MEKLALAGEVPTRTLNLKLPSSIRGSGSKKRIRWLYQKNKFNSNSTSATLEVKKYRNWVWKGQSSINYFVSDSIHKTSSSDLLLAHGYGDSISQLSSEGYLSGLASLEAVLFDIDGTLCNSDPLHFYIFQKMLQEINFNGGAPITKKFFVEELSGKNDEDMGLALFPGDVQRGVKFIADKDVMFRRLAPEKLKAVDGLYKVKKWAEDHGLKRAAVTNAPRANAELIISILGLTDFFDTIILGEDCERPKPYPDPYLKALEALKVTKDHALVFEDSVSGIKAGVAAGLHVIGLTTGFPEHLLIEAKPAFLIKDYNDPKLCQNSIICQNEDLCHNYMHSLGNHSLPFPFHYSSRISRDNSRES